MFGENEIIGEKTINIDSKNRIILPSFTGVEIKDKLIPQLNYTFYPKNSIYKFKSNFLGCSQGKSFLPKCPPQAVLE